MKYSIIIPYGNAEKTIRDCLDSVTTAADRFGGDCEIICINGGCTDQTQFIVDEYAAKSARFVHHGGWPNADGGDEAGDRLGPGRARNVGLQLAKGEYVVFVDADDSLRPDALVALRAATADIVTFLAPKGTWNLTEQGTRRQLFSPMVGNLLAWNAIWRREAIGDWRFPLLRNYEDLVWTAGMFARAKSLEGGVEPWYDHRENVAGSLANSFTWRRVRDGWRATGLIRRACREAHVGAATRLVLARKLLMHRLLHVAAIVPRALLHSTHE